MIFFSSLSETFNDDLINLSIFRDILHRIGHGSLLTVIFNLLSKINSLAKKAQSYVSI